MTDQDQADIVRKELLGLGTCSLCTKDTPKEELVPVEVCDKCWDGLSRRQKMETMYPGV